MKFDLLKSHTDGHGLTISDANRGQKATVSNAYGFAQIPDLTSNNVSKGCSCNQTPMSATDNTMLQSISSYYNQYYATNHPELLRK